MSVSEGCSANCPDMLVGMKMWGDPDNKKPRDTRWDTDRWQSIVSLPGGGVSPLSIHYWQFINLLIRAKSWYTLKRLWVNYMLDIEWIMFHICWQLTMNNTKADWINRSQIINISTRKEAFLKKNITHTLTSHLKQAAAFYIEIELKPSYTISAPNGKQRKVATNRWTQWSI